VILNVTLTNVETREARSIKVEGRSRKAINHTARRELQAPWPEWEASYEVVTDGPVKTSRVKKAQPTIQELAAKRVCPECGGEVVRKSARGPFPTYCADKACKKDRGNRRLVRGAAIIEFAQAWRVNRGSGETAKASFNQMCRILDQFNAEDHAANRPRADLCAAKILADGSLYMDRQKGRTPGRKQARPEQPVEAPAQLDLALILQQIADGHNDARGLAAEAIARLS
jgi:hypothetical protein